MRTKTMRKEWPPIPRGICSLPLTDRHELHEHLKNIRERNLQTLECEVMMPVHVRGISRRDFRKMKIRMAIEKIEDECIKQGLRMTDNIVVISRVKGGFIIWAIGYKLRKEE